MPAEQEIDRLAASLRERFGARLSNNEAAVVRERIAAMLQAGEALRAAPLDNAGEPFTVFTPLTPPPPTKMNELVLRPIRELAELIRKRQVSPAPLPHPASSAAELPAIFPNTEPCISPAPPA